MATEAKEAKTAKKQSLFQRLYSGTGAFDIVGKRKIGYVVFGTLVAISLLSIVFRGFNLGIEFVGGTQLSMPATSATGPISVGDTEQVFKDTLNKEAHQVQSVGSGGSASINIRSATLNQDEIGRLKQALTDKLHPNGAVSDSAVSASWGGEISKHALFGLLVFLVLVTIFLVLYFEPWMAVAALISLVHDVGVTAGVYSLIGFEVTPATVIGLLTILGFSLYDTVVVFDRVKEVTRGLLGLTRRTYAEAANLALNHTLMRSINTSLIALLPVLGLLVVGVGLLGVGTLKDLALVQMTGLLAGAVSSIFLATPLLVDFKMRDPRYKQQAQRVLARRASHKAASLDEAEPTDADAIDAEVRKEKAMAVASSVPARNPKAADRKRGKHEKPEPKPSRPTGKRGR